MMGGVLTSTNRLVNAPLIFTVVITIISSIISSSTVQKRRLELPRRHWIILRAGVDRFM